MSAFRADHTRRSHAFTIARPMAEAFRLFEPEGERAWAPGWDPVYIHPQDGRAAPGMVFTTGEGEEATIWMCTRHDPAAGIVEYLRVTPALRTGSVLVHCTAIGEQRTRVNVVYTLTALSEKGNAWLREMDEARYRDFIESWKDAIDALPWPDRATAGLRPPATG